MKHFLRILHLENSSEDCELVECLLLKEGIAGETKRVDTRTQLFDTLQNESFDLILADCKLPRFSGLQALEIARALKPLTGLVLLFSPLSGLLGRRRDRIQGQDFQKACKRESIGGKETYASRRAPS